MIKHNIPIRQYLLENGLVQRDLAAALHVHEATISRWLNKQELSEEKKYLIIGTIKRLASVRKEDRDEQ